MSAFYCGLEATGYTALSGERGYRIMYRGEVAYLPDSELGNRALGHLAKQGVRLHGHDGYKALNEKLYYVDSFPSTLIADRAGWNGPYFAYPDGSIISPTGSPDVESAIIPAKPRFSAAGSVSSWKSDVAALITGQPLLMMTTMLTLAPAILEFCPYPVSRAFELVGESSSGLRMAQAIAASAMGNPRDYGGVAADFSRAHAHLDEEYERHQGLLLIASGIDVLIAGAKRAQRTAFFKDYMFHHAGLPGGGDMGQSGAMSLAINARSMALMADGDEELADLSACRLITLHVANDRPFGVFDHLPDEYADSSRFSGMLTTACAVNHGTALPAFLQWLAAARVNDEGGLRQRVVKHMAVFRKRSKVDLNDHAALQVADAFGLIFAAGHLARSGGILPECWLIGTAVLSCFNLHRAGTKRILSLIERIREIATAPGVVHIGGPGAPAAEQQIADASVFLNHKPRGTELLIRRRAIASAFPDYRVVLATAAARKLMVMERGHKTVKRRLAKGEDERVYCFAIPSE